MLKFVSHHLKIKTIYKPAFKKLPFLIRYIPEQCKTQKMYDKVILEKGGTLESVPDCSKNQ